MTVKWNAEEAELNKFSVLAHKWWDPESEFKPLHQINPVRLGFITAKLPLKGLRILDVGCGGGILSESMAAQGGDVVGIDLGQKALNVAKLHSLETGIAVDYRQISAEALAEIEVERFDVVTCMEMLEHVPDPGSVVQACAKLVKPGGHLFFSTINRNPKAYLMAVIGAEYLLNILPKGTHDYSKFIKPSELASWLRQAHLELIEQKGMHYHPLTQTFSLHADVSVNYMVHAVKPS